MGAAMPREGTDTGQVTIVGPDDLRWRDFSIPDGSPDIGMARLHVDEDGAFTVLVEFPPGWERPVTGHYDAAEEALILEGDLTMSGRVHHPGEFARWGVDYTRTGTSAPQGSTVVAWFSGLNTWTRGATDRTDLDAACRWEDVEPQPLGDLPAPRPLSVRDDVSVAVWDEVPAGATLTVSANLFAIATRRFAHVPAGAPLPALAGPALLRVRCNLHEI